MTEQSCKLCRFGNPGKIDTHDGEGWRERIFCRRFPPVDGKVPVMRPEEWCGEFAGNVEYLKAALAPTREAK